MKSIRIALSPTRNRPLNVFLGLVLSLVSLLLLLSLITYHASDPSLNTATGPIAPSAVHNWIGLFGAWMSDLLLQTLGLTAFFLPLWLGGIGWTWMHSRPSGSFALRWIGTLLALVFLPTVMGLLPWHVLWLQLVPIEGVVGRMMAGVMVRYLNIQGAWVVASVLAGAGIYFASAVSFRSVWESLQDRWFQVSGWHDRWRSWREEREERRQVRVAEKMARRSSIAQPEQSQQVIPGIGPEPEDEETQEASGPRPRRLLGFLRRRNEEAGDPFVDVPAFQRAAQVEEASEAIPISVQPAKPSIWERAVAEPGAPNDRSASLGWSEPLPAPEAAAEQVPIKSNVVPMQPRPDQPRKQQPRQEEPWREGARQEQARLEQIRQEQARPAESQAPQARPAVQPAQFEAAPRPASSIAIHNRADAELRTAPVAPKNVSGFKLPPSTLLNAGDGPQAVREDELRQEAKVLVEKYAEFDVRGQVVQINPEPMVTTYEFKPEAGVKYSRVTGLADDLCLAMRAESILIERMAGKSTVGIQVPNHERETIHLRDVIESETFSKAKSRLTLAMGKDINGRIVTADLASMPHVLIAGSTGSGKSVAINAMIMSLLYRTTPQQVRLILVDPKRVELGMYEGIPHLFTPIITEPKAAANVLRNAVCEMERRLKLLASRSVRNLDQYNRLFEASALPLFGPEDDEEEEGPLPYIVIIIDELADLMMLDRANVEESITRLAQMARAVGIHLILATQRPSVDVITGLIKANVPTRISFRLATKVDSRTILDTNGAESLLGRGDMLFLPPGTSRLMRLHAPYVSEKETAAVVGFWKAQGEAEYVEGFTDSPKDERTSFEGAGGEEDNDPLFDDAVRLVFEFGKASTSLLQRRLRVGYGRAAHLIDMMEMDGLVGPSSGSKPRDLLKQPGWLHEVPSQDE